MNTVDKQMLRELAEKATPGMWWIDSHGLRMHGGDGLETVFIADDRMGELTRNPETGNLSHWPNDWDASYIAEANPATILALLDEIEALRAQTNQRWISVDDSMPEVGSEVIGIWKGEGPVVCVWDGLHWGDACDIVAVGYDITHWMPLPDPPQA